MADEEAICVTELINPIMSREGEMLRLTNYETLCAIYAIQNFIRANQNRYDSPGEPYGPGFFTNNCQYSGIYRESRRVAMRLIVSPCIICGDPLGRDSVGDHIVPVSKGGRDGISNFIPLCRKHNASKESRDLMEWGLINGFIDKFTPDVLCAYAREELQYRSGNDSLVFEAPVWLMEAFKELAKLYLPNGIYGRHWKALIESLKTDIFPQISF